MKNLEIWQARIEASMNEFALSNDTEISQINWEDEYATLENGKYIPIPTPAEFKKEIRTQLKEYETSLKEQLEVYRTEIRALKEKKRAISEKRHSSRQYRHADSNELPSGAEITPNFTLLESLPKEESEEKEEKEPKTWKSNPTPPKASKQSKKSKSSKEVVLDSEPESLPDEITPIDGELLEE